MTRDSRASPLAERVNDPGFTPSVRDVGALVELLDDADRAPAVQRALGRVGAPAVPILAARLKGAPPPVRARIVRALGRLAAHEATVGVLLAALGDADPKTRRNAAIALGHAPRGRPDVEDALLNAWELDARTEMHRSIAAALGKAGTARSLPVLIAAADDEDAELSRIAAQASIMVERTGSRTGTERIDAARRAAAALAVEVLARRGVEDLLAEELSAVQGVDEVRVAGPGRVTARLVGPMEVLFRARTMLSFRFPIEPEPLSEPGGLGAAVARAATGETARAVFATWSPASTRYRIAWAQGGHRRAETWSIARAIAARAPALVNDPTASTWELVVSTQERRAAVALAPRALDDPRFAWRRQDVPAASHPTLAAALARVAGASANDVVWDPFVGSGAELIERALLGPYASLRGGDVDPRALSAARANVETARLPIVLEAADALSRRPTGVTLVITNPPMGRRASRQAGLAEMLDAFVTHAASVLEGGGRLVWIAPWPDRSRAAAARAELRLEWARTVDMGGFEAEMQRWAKPSIREAAEGSTARRRASRGNR
ncbi:MAG TPA: HEAT repeat domain-containing protein [Polyangiaceae bacterium]|nr:HEAT repeat domain-containing protein [Polyangiaceae bacterium]